MENVTKTCSVGALALGSPTAKIWPSTTTIPHPPHTPPAFSCSLGLVQSPLGPSCCWGRFIVSLSLRHMASSHRLVLCKEQKLPFCQGPSCKLHWHLRDLLFLIQTATYAFKNKVCMDRILQPVHRRGCNSMPGPPKGLAIYCWRKKASFKTGCRVWALFWFGVF